MEMIHRPKPALRWKPKGMRQRGDRRRERERERERDEAIMGIKKQTRKQGRNTKIWLRSVLCATVYRELSE